MPPEKTASMLVSNVNLNRCIITYRPKLAGMDGWMDGWVLSHHNIVYCIILYSSTFTSMCTASTTDRISKSATK